MIPGKKHAPGVKCIILAPKLIPYSTNNGKLVIIEERWAASSSRQIVHCSHCGVAIRMEGTNTDKLPYWWIRVVNAEDELVIHGILGDHTVKSVVMYQPYLIPIGDDDTLKNDTPVEEPKGDFITNRARAYAAALLRNKPMKV